MKKDFERQTADRIIKYLASQTSTLEGLSNNKTRTFFTAATRAYKNGEK
jgi:hypothetical protein